jgi:hypothetical protein
MRSITRAMRSTPIPELETITGLQPMENIRDSRSQRHRGKVNKIRKPPNVSQNEWIWKREIETI